MKRVELILSYPQELVGFNYQHKVGGRIHKWLGNKNKYHDGISLYSYSWLMGEFNLHRNGLFYIYGAKLQISSYFPELIDDLLKGIKKDKLFIHGMKVEQTIVTDVPVFEKQKYDFKSYSPILLRKQVGDERKYFTFKDSEANDRLTEIMHKKMSKVGLHGDLVIKFDETSPVKKIKLMDIRGLKHPSSICGIIVEGEPELIRFAYTVGVGHSTGMGFGFLTM
jgi:CRISPR-associated endoribonuclease Cas6